MIVLHMLYTLSWCVFGLDVRPESGPIDNHDNKAICCNYENVYNTFIWKFTKQYLHCQGDAKKAYLDILVTENECISQK